MRLLTSQLLFTCFIFAFFLTIYTHQKWDMRFFENRLFTCFCLSSAIWGFGFWGINVQTTFRGAYICRTVGMIGVFAMLIIAQIMICHLSTLPPLVSRIFVAFSLLGIIIYVGLLPKDTVTYYMSSIGMTYSFNPGFWNNVYVGYTIILAINLFITIIYTLNHTSFMHTKLLMKKLLSAELFIVFGMLLDTVFPLIGKPAFPGSTIGQFVGVLVIYDAISFINRTRININNMSKYVYSSLSLPVLVYDSKHRLQIINDAAYTFFGIRTCREDTRITDLFRVDDASVFEYEGSRNNLDTVCLSNLVECSLAISKIFNDYGDLLGYIIIVADLSDRMQAFKNLKEATKAANTANQAKTTFLANMSHEIRTPMNAIIGFSELLLKMDISPQAKEHVEDIRISSQNLLAIINDILDITKIESGKMELIPECYYLGKLLDDVTLIISQQAKTKGLDFHIEIDPAVPTQLYGDKIRIRGVLINILNNAVKYTKKGSVTFQVSIVEQTKDSIKMAYIIRDTGIGIRQEDLPSLFDNFSRLEKNIHYGIEGSGLGLAISNAYVTMMGGEIKVESEYGKGSVFTVLIDQKVIDATAMDHQLSIQRRDTLISSQEHIKIHDTSVLVVDDNHINLRVAEGLLSSYGLNVSTTDNGFDAVSLCQENHYDIVFMDQMMPEMDGIAAMQQIRQIDDFYALGGEGKIIVLTADAIRGVRESLLNKGFDEYLGKPMNLNQLERLLVLFVPEEKIEHTISENGTPSEESLDTPNDRFASISYLQETLPSVNIEAGIALSGNDLPCYLDILKINYSYGEKSILEISDYLTNQDFENFTIKIHALKSTLKGIGADALSKKALDMETAGKEHRFDFIEQNFPNFKVEFLDLMGSLEEGLQHFGLLDNMQEDQTQDGALLEGDQMQAVISNIRMKINEFEFGDVFEIIEQLEQYQKSDKQTQFLEKLKPLMDDLDVEQIQVLLDEYS